MIHWSMSVLYRVVVDIVWLNIELEWDVIYKERMQKTEIFLRHYN